MTETITIEPVPLPTVIVEGEPRGPVGPAGPTGPQGPVASDQGLASARPAGKPKGFTWWSTDTGELWQSNGSSYTLINRPEVKHTWAKDGTSGWTQQLISTDGTHAPNTLSVVSGRGRVASAVTDTPGQYRECWLRDGTEWADSEIRSVWYPPSTLDPAVCTPQMGHVHRGSTTGGILVDQNITGNAFEVTYLANWKWASDGSPAGFGIGLNTTLAGGTAQYPLVRAVSRFNSSGWKNIYYVNDPGQYAIGDTVTITGCIDSTFNVNATVTAAGRDPNTSFSLYGPYIITDSAGSTTAVSQKTEVGYVSYQAPAVNAINPKLIYPMNVISRLVGTVLSLKKWRVGTPEPAWGAPFLTATLDIGADTNPVPPTSGKCGIVANHLRGVNWMEYGDVTMTQL